MPHPGLRDNGDGTVTCSRGHTAPPCTSWVTARGKRCIRRLCRECQRIRMYARNHGLSFDQLLREEAAAARAQSPLCATCGDSGRIGIGRMPCPDCREWENQRRIA